VARRAWSAASRARISSPNQRSRLTTWLIVDGPVGKLGATLLHESFRSLEEVLEKVNRYSSLSAQQMSNSGRRGGVATAALHGLGAFLKTYVLKAGFLDGREGFMLAVSNGEGAYYKYVKLFLRNRQR